MAKNNSKQYNMAKPTETHHTAAWANIHETKDVSNVTIPSELQVNNAKEWVDTNQK